MLIRLPRAFLFATLLLFTGCAGRGTIHLVSLNMTEVDPPEAKAWQFPSQENYWWIDANGELNVSILHGHSSVLGKFGSFDVGLSLVFDEAPAGRAKNYKVGPREARASYTSAMANMRFVPYAGIVSVVIGKDNILRGSFRLWSTALSEVNILSILPQRPGNVLLFGTFEAIRDEARGQRIRSKVETGAPPRPAKKTPTTQPK
ncbi:MAG: hypothetical protein AABZ08_07820 [Planctomycetota bacterium]